MSSTTFVNGVTLTDASWFNDVNDAIYQETPLGYGGTAGGTADALTLSPSPAISAYVTGNQFTFKAASANTGAATVAVSGLAAKAIQNNGSALTAGQIEAGKWYVIVYDGTAFQITKVAFSSVTVPTTTVPRLLENVGISISMAANAVTIALKGADGNDPSSTNVVGIGFRNATVTNGQASKVSVVAALSTVISSGSTGGTINAQPSRIWYGALLTGGAAELWWFQALSGTSIAPINEGGVISTTAEGGAGGADTAQTFYSTTARANVPATVIGYFDSTQATAGTWASSPTTVVVNPAYRPGDIVQKVNNQTGAVATGTTTIPNDDTIPQNTEGDQYLTQSVTPRFSANVLEVTASGHLANSGSSQLQAALFKDSGADAIASVIEYINAAASPCRLEICHRILASSTSSQTFNYRGGASGAGTTTFNGAGGARMHGGVLNSYIDILEIMA